jgi:hypothetical protein
VSPYQIVKKITRSLKLIQPIKKYKTRKSKSSKSEIPRRVLKTKIKDVPGTSIESDLQPSTINRGPPQKNNIAKKNAEEEVPCKVSNALA